MAAVVSTADMTIQRNSQILVNVDEALVDLIVVSYCTDDKKFQGVLLDSSKGNLPFGVYSLHPALSSKSESTDNNDKLHSVSQRFLYQEPQYATENAPTAKKPGPKGKSQPKQKMTVRLRPRKVLCSNCKGICNENSENVDVSKKRKLESHDGANNRSESSVREKKFMSSMLIPKLERLEQTAITSAMKGGTKQSTKANEKPQRSNKSEKSGETETRELTFVSVSNNDCDKQDSREDNAFNSMFSSARTLKICFGEGEGTVVKIPPLSGDFNEDSGVSCDVSKPELKAAKKALKKAKKQAKRNNSTNDCLVQSPRYNGALSPRNNMCNSPPRDPLEKKHRHKVKHKKKSKVQKKRDENSSKTSDGESNDYFGDIKEHCLNQKLSISLRRLSSNSYERRSEQDSGSEECEGDTIPNFPQDAAEGAGGRLIRVSPGDVVWGKVIGFPWWPGRVLSVTPTSLAHVAWYACNTSSLVAFDSLSPFLEDYKLRFNDKKRGSYKEAVKQATIDAKQNESHIQDPLASPTHLPAMSPRPINVFS